VKGTGVAYCEKIQQREDLKGRSDFREVDVDGRIILKRIAWKYFLRIHATEDWFMWAR
jgi:hypothetical protein